MKFLNSSSHRRVPIKNNKSGSRSRYVKFIVILAILIGIGYWFISSGVITSKQIEITGVDSAKAEEIRQQILSAIEDKPGFAIKEGYLTDLIREKFPNLKLNEMKYEFPNKYMVDMQKREGKYNIQANNGVFRTDEEGMVLGAVSESTESMDIDMFYDKSVEVGKRIEDTSVQAGLIYAQLNQRVKIEGGQIHLNMDNGGQIILPNNTAVEKANELFGMLQKIIQKYTIDNKQIDFIDLRFSKPVIKYKE